MSIEITDAMADDWPAALALLDAAGLPTDDLAAGRLTDFLVARQDGDSPVVGLVGLEQHADRGLLRSLVVDTTNRGSGLGRKLVARLEEKAAAAGIAELWLLTIDADAFFASAGYAVAAREHAPEVIRATREFSDLCPADAVLMRKILQA